jgi:LCP family protein required for cell wall assembly
MAADVRRAPRSRLAAFGTRIVIALVLVGAVTATGVYAVNSMIRSEVDRIPRIAVNTTPAPDGGANYLVVGSDSREFVETDEDIASFGDPDKETGKRSDSIMVVHVEPDAGESMILSFPRDLWVNVPGIGNTKINAAFNSELGGGPDSIIATLKSNFGIDINHYMEVDFVTFREIVDALGRVPVYVDRPAIDEFTGFVAVKAGCYELDGAEALTWVRSRHLKYLNPQTGRMEEDMRADIGRIERQQEFIRRLAATVVDQSLSNPLKAREISNRVVDHLKVDEGFDTRDALDLVAAFRHVNPDDTSALEFVTFPFREGNAGGQAVLFPDKTTAAPVLEQVNNFDAAPPAPAVAPSDVEVKVLNGTGRSGVASAVTSQLSGASFNTAEASNDERGRVSVSEVRFANGAEAKARALLPYVGSAVKLVPDPKIKDVDVVVVLGIDFTGLVNGPGGAAPPASGDPAAATAPPDSAAAAAAACR